MRNCKKKIKIFQKFTTKNRLKLIVTNNINTNNLCIKLLRKGRTVFVYLVCLPVAE